MSETQSSNPFENNDPELDDLSANELESMLSEAESALHRIRLELRERYAENEEKTARLTAQDMEELMPKHSLTENEGHWVDLVKFLRQFVAHKDTDAK